MENNLTLEQSITKKTEEQIKEHVESFSEKLCDMTRTLYKSYNLLRQDPINKLDGHMMVFQSRLGDPLTGDVHGELFKIAFDNNLDIFSINKKFREDVEAGKAIELGDVVIIDTAISHILMSNELKFSISFMLREDYEEKKKLEEEEKENIKNL